MCDRGWRLPQGRRRGYDAVMFLLLALEVIAAAVCPAEPAALSASLDRAESAFNDMDERAFRQAVNDAAADADCLTQPIDSATAARLHRMVGLRAFVDGDEAAARLAFAAARAVEPVYAFPESFLPRNHPALALYGEAAQLSGAADAVDPPAQGQLQFDGQASLARPRAWPTVAVLVDPAGNAEHSAYLSPGEPLFPYPVAPPEPDARRLNTPLAVSAGLSLLGSGVLYGLARASYDRFYDPVTPDGDLAALQDRTNRLYYTSVGAAALGVGAGIGAFTVRWR